MIARASENYLAISRSSSASKSEFLGRDILGTTFFRPESSLIQSSCRFFIGVIVPYEISKVETKILVSMSEEI